MYIYLSIYLSIYLPIHPNVYSNIQSSSNYLYIQCANALYTICCAIHIFLISPPRSVPKNLWQSSVKGPVRHTRDISGTSGKSKLLWWLLEKKQGG